MGTGVGDTEAETGLCVGQTKERGLHAKSTREPLMDLGHKDQDAISILRFSLPIGGGGKIVWTGPEVSRAERNASEKAQGRERDVGGTTELSGDYSD